MIIQLLSKDIQYVKKVCSNYPKTFSFGDQTQPQLTPTENQSWSEYKHSLTFRVRRYTNLLCIVS